VTTQHLLWTADGVALALVLVAGAADWRRSKRTNLDATGWVPWRGIQMAAIFAVVVLATLAVRS
jgi:hypothetical protein